MAITKQYYGLKLNDKTIYKLCAVNPTVLQYYPNTGNVSYYPPTQQYFSASEMGLITNNTLALNSNQKYTLENNSYISVETINFSESYLQFNPGARQRIMQSNLKNRSVHVIAGECDGGYRYVGYVGIDVSQSTERYYIIIMSLSPEQATAFVDGAYEDSTDPYGLNGGASTPGGGGGDFDNTSQPIDFPQLPNISATDTGFITLYNPSLSQLRELSAFMWSTDFFDNILKLWADPMDVILNLSMIPVNIPESGTREMVVGNVSTGISMSVAATQFMYVDCGMINVKEYWGAYLDYSPYTKISIYLPYIGIRQLNIDEVMNTTVHVKYSVDILSGACVAFIKCGSSVLYNFSGNCGNSIPVTSQNFARTMQSLITGVTNIAGGIAKGGVSPSGIGQAAGSLVNTAVSVATAKPDVQRSGSVVGNNGLLSHQYPYLILERPRQCVPHSQNAYMGYPAFIEMKLSDCHGYTVISEINMQNVPATDSEINEIIQLLKEGVIL